MSHNFSLFFFLIFSISLLPFPVRAMGEDVLAQCGQYSFFIKPHPGACMTYHQKMVPCVAEKNIPIPRPVVQTYPLPFPVKRGLPVVVSEKPVGCAANADSCLECYPQPSCKPGIKESWPAQIKPIRISSPEFSPRHVTRKIMLPQWFLVTDHPVPAPKPPIKVRTGG